MSRSLLSTHRRASTFARVYPFFARWQSQRNFSAFMLYFNCDINYRKIIYIRERENCHKGFSIKCHEDIRGQWDFIIPHEGVYTFLYLKKDANRFIEASSIFEQRETSIYLERADLSKYMPIGCRWISNGKCTDAGRPILNGTTIEGQGIRWARSDKRFLSVGVLSTCDNIDPPRWWPEMNERQKIESWSNTKQVRLSDFQSSRSNSYKTRRA